MVDLLYVAELQEAEVVQEVIVHLLELHVELEIQVEVLVVNLHLLLHQGKFIQLQ